MEKEKSAVEQESRSTALLSHLHRDKGGGDGGGYIQDQQVHLDDQDLGGEPRSQIYGKPYTV